MEKIELKIHYLNKALFSLNQALYLYDDVKDISDERIALAAKDSIIQRFEYSYDSFWKVLKIYLEYTYNLENVNSPRAVFHACVERNVCTPDEGLILVNMLGDRNVTSHTYDVDQARKILPNIGNYYRLMHKITHKILPQMNS